MKEEIEKAARELVDEFLLTSSPLDADDTRKLAAAITALATKVRDEALEEAARKCEAVVTFSPEHGNYIPENPAVPCGWCDGLEKAAGEIRTLRSAATREGE